jgi:hypothetical protein
MCVGVAICIGWTVSNREVLKGLAFFIGTFFPGVWMAAVAPLFLILRDLGSRCPGSSTLID